MSNGIGVLVTGYRGFIGNHVYETLFHRGYDLEPYDIEDGLDVTVYDDVEMAVTAFKCQWIVHLAGQVFLTPSLENPQHDAETNIIGTLNVLEAARKNKCGVIFSSSGAVYGNNYQFPDPISPYGLSKLTAERYCQLYHYLYNVHTVVFRFSSIYGIGRKKTSVNLILDKILKDEVITVTGDGNQTRDFTHVSDVVEAIVLAVNGNFPSGVYDIGTGTATSINELVAMVERMLGKKVKVKYISGVKADPKRNELNVSKAERCGFKAKVSLMQGIKQLLEDLK
jgi:nucleoside-diphosphate-sugar epimerase